MVKLAANELGKSAWQIDNEDDDLKGVYAATYVLVSSRPQFFEHALFRRKLRSIVVPSRLREWTDDYSSLWQLLDFKNSD